MCMIYAIHVYHVSVQPIADGVAHNLEIIIKKIQFSIRRTRILMGFIIYYMVLLVNPMGRILVRWKCLKNHFEILCHPCCNQLYDVDDWHVIHKWYDIRNSWIWYTWCTRYWYFASCTPFICIIQPLHHRCCSHGIGMWHNLRHSSVCYTPFTQYAYTITYRTCKSAQLKREKLSGWD